MPQYTCYHDESHPAPIFPENDIQNLSNLKAGDYLVLQQDLPEYNGEAQLVTGMTTVWNIIKVTKKCVYVEDMICGRNYKQICLKWQGNRLVKGMYGMSFGRFVKQEDMDLGNFFAWHERPRP